VFSRDGKKVRGRTERLCRESQRKGWKSAVGDDRGFTSRGGTGNGRAITIGGTGWHDDLSRETKNAKAHDGKRRA